MMHCVQLLYALGIVHAHYTVCTFNSGKMGYQDGVLECTLTSQLSSLGLNPDRAVNGHAGVSQAG